MGIHLASQVIAEFPKDHRLHLHNQVVLLTLLSLKWWWTTQQSLKWLLWLLLVWLHIDSMNCKQVKLDYHYQTCRCHTETGLLWEEWLALNQSSPHQPEVRMSISIVLKKDKCVISSICQFIALQSIPAIRNYLAKTSYTYLAEHSHCGSFYCILLNQYL